MSLHSSTTFRAREQMSVFALRLFSRILQHRQVSSQFLYFFIFSPLITFTQSGISSSRNDPDTPSACAFHAKVVSLNSKWQGTVKQIWWSVTVHELTSSNIKGSCMNRSLTTILDTKDSNWFTIYPIKSAQDHKGGLHTKKSQMRDSSGCSLHRKVLLQCQESLTALADLQPGPQAMSSKKSLRALTTGWNKKEFHYLAGASCWFIWWQKNASDIFKNLRQFKDTLPPPPPVIILTHTEAAASAQIFKKKTVQR